MAEKTTTAEEDRTLIERVGRGDHKAFRALMERYRRPLHAFILRMVRRPPIAEELVQETFVRAFRAAPRYKPIAPVSTWLFRIASNLALNEAALAHHLHEVSYEAQDATAEAAQPLEQLEHKELARRIEEALARLPAQQRAAVVLARFEDMPYREIAEVLGLSEAAVDGLLQRARQTLTKLLRPAL